MKVLGILFFSCGVLLILFGIFHFTPLLSWIRKKLNKSNFSSVNYNKPKSIDGISIFMGICLFIFGLLITIASAALLDISNIPENAKLSISQSVSQKTEIVENNKVSQKPEIVETPIVAAPNSTNAINPENKSSVLIYKLNCLPEADGLNMRKQAGLNTEIITIIPCDAIGIEDKEEKDYQNGVEWYLVKYKQNIGWVAGKYLEPKATKPKNNKNAFLFRFVAKKRP